MAKAWVSVALAERRCQGGSFRAQAAISFLTKAAASEPTANLATPLRAANSVVDRRATISGRMYGGSQKLAAVRSVQNLRPSVGRSDERSAILRSDGATFLQASTRLAQAEPFLRGMKKRRQHDNC